MTDKLLAVRCVLLTVAVLLPWPSGWAQDAADTPQQEAGSPSANPRAIEEIRVFGERSLLSMRNEIARIEEDMYRQFNELNNSDELDIYCVSETNTRSHIRQRRCEPVFLSDLKKENAQSAVAQIRHAYTDEGLDVLLLQNGLDWIESEQSLKDLTSAKYQALSAEILRIATENPDYREALLRIGRLKAEYELARSQRFGEQ